MPRQARLDAPGTLHHIMVRGTNKSVIFADDQDRTRFLERLGQNVINGECSVYAWVLMDNHAHILFKSGRQGISAVMRKLLTWYAQYFNRRHRRTGHLFENRYKSILCDEDNYLLALIRYIHLNPVRANIVTTLKELGNYSWSGHRAIMGNTRHDWMDTAYILSRFAARKKAARSSYCQFMAEECKKRQINKNELTGGGRRRKVSTLLAVIAKRSLDELGLTMAEIARHVGVTTSSIAKAVV